MSFFWISKTLSVYLHYQSFLDKNALLHSFTLIKVSLIEVSPGKIPSAAVTKQSWRKTTGVGFRNSSSMGTTTIYRKRCGMSLALWKPTCRPTQGAGSFLLALFLYEKIFSLYWGEKNILNKKAPRCTIPDHKGLGIIYRTMIAVTILITFHIEHRISRNLDSWYSF